MGYSLTRVQYFIASFIFSSYVLGSFFTSFFVDSSLRITSESNSFNFLSYFFGSYFAYINYVTGTWIIGFFLVYSFFYFIIFKKRQHWSNPLAFPILILSFIGLSFIFSPNSLGNGIYFVLKKQIDESYLIISTIIFSLFAFYICIGESFLKNLDFIKEFSEKIYEKCEKPIFFVTRVFSNLLRVGKKLYSGIPLRNKVKEILKGKESQTPALSYGSWTEEEVSEDEDEDEEEDSYSSSEELEEESFDEQSSEPILQTQENPIEKRPKKRAKTIRKTSITSSELIESISVQSKNSTLKNPDSEYFEQIIEAIENKLAEFNIGGKIINILKGPVVDTFELELGTGVKVSKVNSISKDLSLALCGAPIRIVYPMRGKSTIGVEVPRNPREIIYLDEVLKSKEYSSSAYRLPIAMGKNAFGEPFIVDLASMPHMLVAGATGAGKSVFINTLLVSLLIKLPPEKMKLILIDPKQLELALYASLPHLILPVMTDSKAAAMSLLWACQEMERRYSLLKEVGVRNIESFNKKVAKGESSDLIKIHHLYEEVDPDKDGYEIPYIVIIVDEFADLILTKMGKDIENNICRLAAKARAAGIHLVLATQRPSVDVITGLIKANFPTRVSFRVTSNIDSRTILNAQGAEMLLGMGDMLYKHGIEMLRLHSGYVDEEEIEGLVEKLGEIPCEFNEAALEFIENEGNLDEDSLPEGVSYTPHAPSGDALYDKAVQVVMEHRQASASMLQRRLKIGYNRAANLIDQLEENGIVGPQQGSKPRDVIGG